MNAKLKILIKSVIAIILLGFLFSQINFAQFIKELNNANLFLILIAAALVYPSIYISVLKWDLFLKNYDLHISKLKLYSIYSISSFFNNFLPTSIGGDTDRFLRLKNRFPKKKKEVASSIILERFSGFFVLFIANFILVPFFIDDLINNKIFIILESALVFGFIAILAIVFFAKKINITSKHILRFKIIKKLLSLVSSLYDLKNKKTILFALGYSLIFLFIIVFARSIVFYAFGIEVPFLYIILVSVIVRVVGIIPISLNSIGITEGLSIFLYSLIGIAPEISLAVVLVGRVSLIITSSLGGIFYFFDNKINF